MKRLFSLGMIIVFLSGCVHAISRSVMKEVDEEITFSELHKDSTAYKGKVVLLGGVIVETVNKQEGTLLEVYQTRLDREGKPIKTDISEGRFLAFYNGFLDAAIYRKRREVTIAGTVEGERVQPLGEMKYRYPYLVIREIHLWKEEEPTVCEPCPWDYRDPWWHPWYPWRYPRPHRSQ